MYNVKRLTGRKSGDVNYTYKINLHFLQVENIEIQITHTKATHMSMSGSRLTS